MATLTPEKIGRTCRDFAVRLGKAKVAPRYSTAAEALFNHRPEAAVWLSLALLESTPNQRGRFFEALALEIKR